MINKKNRFKSFIGGIVLGGLIGSYITFIFMANNIISKIDICNTMDCVRYVKVNIGK